jgi:hypothetical protein
MTRARCRSFFCRFLCFLHWVSFLDSAPSPWNINLSLFGDVNNLEICKWRDVGRRIIDTVVNPGKAYGTHQMQTSEAHASDDLEACVKFLLLAPWEISDWDASPS